MEKIIKSKILYALLIVLVVLPCAYFAGIAPAQASLAVIVTATPNPIPYNTGSTISWTALGATSCIVVNTTTGAAVTGALAYPAVATYATVNLTGNTTYTVTCTGPDFTITASGNHCSVTPSGATTVEYGSSQDYSIAPDAGYELSSVSVDGANQGTIGSYTFANVTANHTISAMCTPITYAVTASGGANGSMTPLGTQTVNHGASISYTITPSAGYSASVGGSCIGSPASGSSAFTYTITSITSNCTVVATFSPIPTPTPAPAPTPTPIPPQDPGDVSISPSAPLPALHKETFDVFVQHVGRYIINPIIILLFGLAVAYFLWGLLRFLANPTNEQMRSSGKKHMIYGIIGMAIMMGVFAIMSLILSTSNIKGITPANNGVELNDYDPAYKFQPPQN